jgi:peptide-methionine (R)-S-oxide reductase
LVFIIAHYVPPCAGAQKLRERASMSNTINKETENKDAKPLPKSDAEWRKRLAPEEYAV